MENKWEYKSIESYNTHHNESIRLAGLDGWELVSVVSISQSTLIVYFF